MGSAEDDRLLELSLRAFVEALGAPEPAPAGGSAAALGTQLAAALVAKCARLSTRQLAHEAPSLAERALAIRDEAARLVTADADAYGRFLATRRHAADSVPALAAAAATVAIPLRIAELALEVAERARLLAERGNPRLRGDAIVAVELASAAAHAASALVVENLGPDVADPRRGRASELARDAARHAEAARSSQRPPGPVDDTR